MVDQDLHNIKLLLRAFAKNVSNCYMFVYNMHSQRSIYHYLTTSIKLSLGRRLSLEDPLYKGLEHILLSATWHSLNQ